MEKDYKDLKQKAGPGVFKQWQEVDVVVYAFTDLGVKVAINNEYSGLIYNNEVFAQLYNGQKLKAYIKHVRKDGKIDVSLQPQEEKHLLLVTEKILKMLNASGGRLRFNDYSSAEDIKKKFEISKKAFKKAIGMLYKQRKIKITGIGIEIVRGE